MLRQSVATGEVIDVSLVAAPLLGRSSWVGSCEHVTRSAHAKGLHRHTIYSHYAISVLKFGTGEEFVGPYTIFSVVRYAARQLAGRRQLRSACSVVAD
jgi:hypothetical protein